MKKILVLMVLMLFLSGGVAVYFWLYGGTMLTACPHCRALNRFEEKYCAQCGELTYVLPSCPKCGTKNVMDDDYCVGCAAKLPGKNFYLTMKNRFVQKRESLRIEEGQKIAAEYRTRSDQNEALKNEEIRKQKMMRDEREAKIRSEEQERKNQEYERLQREREALSQKQYQQQMQEQSENS